MKLSNFENYVSSTILQRGKSYYRSNAIMELEELNSGLWKAYVDGSEVYTVFVKLQKDTIVEHHCDCPYDYGDICKHQVAVFSALQEQQNQPVQKMQKNKSKRMTIAQKVQHILERLSEDETKAYLQEKILNDKKHRDHFLIHFDYLLGEKTSPDKYRKMMKQIIRQHSDHGFIDYYAMSGFCADITDLLEQDRVATGAITEKTFMAASVVLEELSEVIGHTDDSNGELGSVVWEAIQRIEEYTKQTTGEARNRAINWSLNLWSNSEYSDYGYDDIDILFNHIAQLENPPQEKLLQSLDQRIAKAREYSKPDLLLTKQQLLSKWGNETAAREILLNNLDEPEIRKILVDEKLEDNAFDEAIQLIKDGIKIAEQLGHPGTVSKWRQQLLDIALKQKQTADILHWAETLFNDRFSLEHYRLLKKHSPDWGQHYQNIITRLKKKRAAYDLAEIYKEEKDSSSLIELVEKQDNYSQLSLLKKYLDIFKQHAPEKALELFENNLKDKAKETGRSAYAQLVEDLKLMKTVEGGEYKAIVLVDSLLNTYNNRPAMREMLLQVLK